jgi:hypothetical protein
VCRSVQGRAFLGTDWVGHGVVRGPLGRVLRSFTVTYAGVWSAPHGAFHVDEEVRYVDGRVVRRHWGIVADPAGGWSGSDDAGGRMVLRDRGDRLVLDFDRSKAVGGFSVGRLRLELTPQGPDVLRGRGVTRWAGLPVARTEITFARGRG